ncbi:unnamed protein product [Didymodactylos carnosus]|uniref:FAD dependent oxidoreductase domain-containing protein n=1 Tax=Didymodactylos carnosus TaxID=1234261 RepID=A0A8S2TVU0_9BILA|nr:unnamed protein product [Didymodactylos carnosus]CAF4307648.1 unnamed protein product [Didymodactylos carnosus]
MPSGTTYRGITFIRLLHLAYTDSNYFKHPIPFSSYTRGTLQLATDRSLFDSLAKDLNQSDTKDQIFSTNDEVIRQEPVLEAVRDRIYGGIYNAMDTNGDIWEFCQNLKEILVEKYQVKFIFNEEVKGFEVEEIEKQKQYRVTAVLTQNGNRIDGDNVVIANGTYMTPLMKQLNVYIPVYPVKGYVVEIITPPNIPLPLVNICDEVKKIYISALAPNSERGVVRVSGLAEFAGWKDIGVVSEPHRAEYLLKQTLSWLPHLSSYPTKFYSCSRPVSPDDVPIIGQVRSSAVVYENVYVNGGHGSKGWTLAFGSSSLLAEIIQNKTQTSIESTPYAPQRFA